MFRKLLGKNKDSDSHSQVSDTSSYFPVTIEIEHSENENQRSQWADPSNSTWEDYEEFFFRDKEWFRDTPRWRQVLKVCHRHWNLDRAIGETYYRREVDGIEPTIPLCREQISFAPQAKVAFEFHHYFDQEYTKQNYERTRRDWERHGWGDYSGWEPVPREFRLPEHRGFKQLAIIYDKMKDFQSAIDVCKEALAVDWPGDWDVRIARYERRLKSKNTTKKKDVAGDVVTVNQSAPTQPTPKFCSHCGSKLEGAVNFCPECGSSIQA